MGTQMEAQMEARIGARMDTPRRMMGAAGRARAQQLTGGGPRRGEFLQGVLGVLILKAVVHEPLHGYAIARWIENKTGDSIRIGESSLYPGLQRLVVQGLLTTRWGMSEYNRRVKLYELTTAGRARLADEAAEWRSFVQAVGRVLSAAPAL